MYSWSVRPILYATGGALATSLLIWWFARRSLRTALADGSSALTAELDAGGQDLQRKLREGAQQARQLVKDEVHRTVPPLVQRTITTTLGEYGITPQLSQQITRIIVASRAAGLLGPR